MRTVSPLAIELILHIYAAAPNPKAWFPAQSELISNFISDGLVCYDGRQRLCVTKKGKEWVDRILNTLPPRGYGGEAEGFYIIGKDEAAFEAIEEARRDAIQKIDSPYCWHGYAKGAYILKAIELLERTEPEYKITYLS